MSDPTRENPEKTEETEEEANAAAEIGADAPDAGGDPSSTDAATPEAIAKRVAALGDEDELERLARDEELKLAARRRATGGKKKAGLEAAASRKLSKIGAKAAPAQRANAVATAVDADPLFEKTEQIARWARKNRALVGGLAAAAVVAGVGLASWFWWDAKNQTHASELLSEAVRDQNGRIGDPTKEPPKDAPKDPSPIFKTADERRDSALAKFREVIARYPGTGPAFLARLDEGSLLLDKHDADGAIAAFDEIKRSALASSDTEVRLRATEGLGFAYEMKANAGGPDAAKAWDQAISAYKELDASEVKGFKELGIYHQARCYDTRGDKAKAKDLLKTLHDRLAAPGAGHTMPQLEELTDDRLRAIDPSAIPPKQPGRMQGPGGNQISDAMIRRMMEQAQKKGGPTPPMPLPPVPGGPK